MKEMSRVDLDGANFGRIPRAKSTSFFFAMVR